ncbi:MAG: P-loop NTPase fold protein [Candidatus Thorarchaeota archaeon]
MNETIGQYKLFNDDPFEFIEEDHLGYKEFLKQIVDLIHIVNPPFSIALNGDWGTGKTRLLELLSRQEIIKEHYHVIRLNIWELENHPNFLKAFSDIGLKSVEYIDTKKKDTIRNQLKKKYPNPFFDMDILFKVGIGTASEILGGKSILDHIKKFIPAEWTNEIIKQRNYFEYMICLIKSNLNKQGIIVLIDDLDRCKPENIIRLLEDIKLFVNVNHCIFICALDRRIISQSIKIKYGKNVDLSGDEYIEKFFQYTVTIPPISKDNLNNFVKYLLKKQDLYFNNIFKNIYNSWSREKIDRDKEIKINKQDLLEEIEALFVSLLDNPKLKNPRRLKKIINKLKTLKKEILYIESLDEAVKFLRFLIVKEVWKEQFEILTSFPHSFCWIFGFHVLVYLFDFD